ncbi:MAG TPA: hypothetical protein VNY83_08790 [Solirubrobacterales bacterium]|nr:hypothetical protein [Solirubrobacterales bacterium]
MQRKATEKENASSMSRIRPKLNYSNVIATIALFVALGGAAVAAGIPKNSVGPRQLKRGAVTTVAIRKGAVTSGKLGPNSVVAGKLGPNSVGPGNIGNGAVTAAKLAKSSVTNEAIANGVVGTNKLGNNVVTTAKIPNGAVTLAKLGNDVAPLLGNLRSGQTLRGTIDLGASTDKATVVRSSTSFQFPLAGTPAAPEANVLKVGASPTPACPGAGQQTPQATAGQLCVYLINASKNLKSVTFDMGSVSRFGFGLAAQFNEEVGSEDFVQGLWAVTAP